MSLEKNKRYNGIHTDTEQCFLNPVYGEMKGILRFVNRMRQMISVTMQEMKTRSHSKRWSA